MKVMNTIGGVAYLREQFYESVSKYMGSTTTLDKKTVRGDVDLMVESEKLGARTEPVSGRKIIFLPTVGEDAIQRYILKEKDSKKATFTDVIHDTEIYFFDQTEKIGFTEERNQLKEFVSFRTAKRMLRSKLQMTLSLRRVRRSTYQMERSKGETKKCLLVGQRWSWKILKKTKLSIMQALKMVFRL